MGLQKREVSITLAIADIYVLDFVINIGKDVLAYARQRAPLTKPTAQSTCRALVVDTLPVEKQQLGSAWGTLVPTLRSD